MTDSVTILFTFGYGQLCPYTGKELGDHYALITAPDRSSARLFMNTAFKRNWAFEYDGPGDVKIADYVPRMTLHITANLVPEQLMPPGFEYVREASDPTGLSYSRADDGVLMARPFLPWCDVCGSHGHRRKHPRR
jgi:hypothetical protein